LAIRVIVDQHVSVSVGQREPPLVRCLCHIVNLDDARHSLLLKPLLGVAVRDTRRPR
jgi:hypothetical protein